MDTAQYKLLLDTAQVGWWEIDFDKRVSYMFGLSGQFVGTER